LTLDPLKMLSVLSLSDFFDFLVTHPCAAHDIEF
jgi:hypothetical protein